MTELMADWATGALILADRSRAELPLLGSCSLLLARLPGSLMGLLFGTGIDEGLTFS